MRCQCLMRIFLRFGVAGLKVVTKGKTLLDVVIFLLRDSENHQYMISSTLVNTFLNY